MGEAAEREDVEALARVIYCAANDTSTGSGLYASEADHLAERILASPWLAAYVAAAVEAARREGAETALREAADTMPAMTEGPLRAGTSLWPECDRDAYSLAIEEAQAAIRARADALRAASEGER